MQYRSSGSLYNSARIFYKLAGLLKVPEDVLQQAQDWIVGCYCHALSEALLVEFAGYKTRKQECDKFLKQLKPYQEIHKELVDTFPYTYDEEDVNTFLNNVAPIMDNLVRGIPKFSYNENSGEAKVNFRDSCFNCLIFQNDDKCDLMLRIKTDKYDVDIGPWSDDGTNLSKEQLWKTLKEHLPKISSVIEDAEEFINYYFLEHDDEHVKERKFVYGMCKKLMHNADIDLDKYYKYTKRFEIPNLFKSGDSPIMFLVEFVPTAIEAKNIDKQPYMGLWSPSGKNSANYLGTAYVYRDVASDADDNYFSFDRTITQLRRVTRHELQHFVQDAISYLKIGDLEMEAGIPGEDVSNPPVYENGKKIRKERMLYPGGTPNIDKSKIPEGIMNKEDIYGRAYHPLRDVEFYTRLSDSVDHFNNVKNKIPIILHKDLALFAIKHISWDEFKIRANDAFEKFIMKNTPGIKGEYDARRLARYEVDMLSWKLSDVINDNFFEMIKKHQPKKYEKACKEFFKAISL